MSDKIVGIGKTKYQLFINGHKGKNIAITVHKDATIKELFCLLEKETGARPEHARLIHGGKMICYDDKHKMISDFPGIVHGSTLFMVFQLLGGEEKEVDDLAPLTDEPDMITWDDDKEGKRVKMPCGHAIGPESLTAYCRSLLTAGKFQFLCPYINPDNSACCNKEWTYIEVRRFAVLNDVEQTFFETKISENYLKKAQGIQECPGCKSLCERKNPKDKRLICQICSKDKGCRFEFCWTCLHKWKSDGIVKCGNEDCDGEDPRIRILREAVMKRVVGVNTPSTRACPTCGTLITHTRDCKHMVCLCGTNFCFICLGMREGGPSGTWSCGTFNTKCTSAPCQIDIPGQ